ncbi:MAG: P22 phage major capsid protein family protein, partial [Candidatus Thorarchaeota archaeon]
MANSILTPLMITREALRILHGKLSFVGNVNRQYDDRFAKTGAKIGTTLNIRMPPKYTVRTGASASYQDHTERSTPLTVNSQAGIDVSFTSVELTMNLDEFAYVVLEPAMSQLAAHVENQCLSDAMSLVANYNGLTTTSGQITFKQFDNQGSILTENLAPYADRCSLLTPVSRNEIIDATKGLFQDSQAIAKQYKEGMLGRTSGFDVFENTFLPSHANGTLAGSPLTTGAALGTSTTANAWVSQTELSVDGANTGTTVAVGDIITFDAVYDVHGETKTNTGVLKRFVVQDAVTLTTQANTYTFNIKP